jgi:uncharacterized protein (DUF983 family)
VSDAARPGIARTLARGLTRRCPRCGRGRLFRRWFTMVPRCPRCGLAFEREEGAFLGSMSLNYAVTGLTLIGLLVGWVATSAPDLDPVVPLIGSLIILTIVPVAFYPVSKTLWAAIDLLLHRLDPQDADTAWGDGER